MRKGAQGKQQQPLLYSGSDDILEYKHDGSSADLTSSEGTIVSTVSSSDDTSSKGTIVSAVSSSDDTSSQGSLESDGSLSNEPSSKGSLSKTNSVGSIVSTSVPEEPQVEARFGGGNYYYSGKIVKDNGDGTYEIKYDNDEEEDNVEKKYINSNSDFFENGSWKIGKEVKVKEEWQWSHERRLAEITGYTDVTNNYNIIYLDDKTVRDDVPAKLIVRVEDKVLDEEVMKKLRNIDEELRKSDPAGADADADAGAGDSDSDSDDSHVAVTPANTEAVAKDVEVKQTVNFKEGDQVKFLKGDKFVHGIIHISDIGDGQCKIKCVKNDSNCSNEGDAFYINANKSDLEIDNTLVSALPSGDTSTVVDIEENDAPESVEGDVFKEGEFVFAKRTRSDDSNWVLAKIVKRESGGIKNTDDTYNIKYIDTNILSKKRLKELKIARVEVKVNDYYYIGKIIEIDDNEKLYKIRRKTHTNENVIDFFKKEDFNIFPKNFTNNGEVEVYTVVKYTEGAETEKWEKRYIKHIRQTRSKKYAIFTTYEKNGEGEGSRAMMMYLRVPVNKEAEDDKYTLKVGTTVSWWNRNADIDNTGIEIKDVKIIQVNEDGTYNISVKGNTNDKRYKNVEKQYLKPEVVSIPEWNRYNNGDFFGFSKSDIKQFVEGSSVKIKFSDGYWYPGKTVEKKGDNWLVDFEDMKLDTSNSPVIQKINGIGLFNIKDIENLDWGRGNIVWVDKSRLNHVDGNDKVRGRIVQFNQGKRIGNIDSYTIDELDHFLSDTGKQLNNVTRHALREKVSDRQGGGARADARRDVFIEPPDPIFNYYKFIINELAWPSGNKFGNNTFVTKNGKVDHGVRDDSFEKYYNGDAYLYKSLEYIVGDGDDIDNLLNQAFNPDNNNPYGFQSSDVAYYEWGNDIRPGGNYKDDRVLGRSVEDKNKHQNRCALLALDAYFIPAFKDNKLIRDDDNDKWKHDALQKYENGSYGGGDHAQIKNPSKRNEWVDKLSKFRAQNGMIDKDISQYACVLRRLMIGTHNEIYVFSMTNNSHNKKTYMQGHHTERVWLTFEGFSKLLTVIFDKMDSDIQIWFENNNGYDPNDPFAGKSLHDVRKAVNGYDHKFDVSYLNKLEGDYSLGGSEKVTFIKEDADNNEKCLRDIIMNLMNTSRESWNKTNIAVNFVLNITLDYYRKELKSILKHLTTKEKYVDVATFKNYTSHDGIELKNIVNDDVIEYFVTFVQDTIKYQEKNYVNMNGCIGKDQPKILIGMFTFIKTTLDMFINGRRPDGETDIMIGVNRSIFERSVTKIRKYLNYADDAAIKSLVPTRNPPNSILSIGDIITRAISLYNKQVKSKTEENIHKNIWFDVFDNGFYFSDKGTYQKIDKFFNVEKKYRMTKRLLHRYPKSGEGDWTGKNLIEDTSGDTKHLIKVDDTICNRTRVGFHGKYGSTVEYLIKYIFLLPTLMDGKRFVFYDKTNNWKALPISINMANIEYYFTLSNLIKQKKVSSEKLNSISLAINSKISREKKQMELDKNAKIIKEIFGGKYNPTIGKSDFWYYYGDTLEDFDESNIKCNSNIRYQAEMLYQLQKLYYHLMTKNSYKDSSVKNMKELGFNYDKRVESDNPFKNSADASKNVARVGKPMIIKDGKKILDNQYPSTSLFLPMRLEGVNLHEQYAGNLYRGQIGGPPLPNYLTISQEQENFSKIKDKTNRKDKNNRKVKTIFRNYIVPTTRNFDNKLRKNTQKHLNEIDNSSGKHMLRGTPEQRKSLEPYIRKLQDFKGDKSCGCGFPEKVSNGKNSYQPPPDFMFGDLVYVRQHFNLSNKGLKRDNRGSDADGIDYIAKDREKQQYNWYYNNGTDIKENTYQAAIVLSDRNKTNDPDGYDTFFISYLNEKTGWGCRGDSMPIGLNGIYTDHKFNKSKPIFINERISYFVEDYKEDIDGKNIWKNNTRCNINESDDEMKARYEKAVKMNDEFACLSTLGLKHAPKVRFWIYMEWEYYTKNLPKNSDFVRNCILARRSSALPYRMYAECATVKEVRDKAYERAKNWLKIMGFDVKMDELKKKEKEKKRDEIKKKLENLMKGNTPIGVMKDDDDKASNSKVQKMHIAVKTHIVRLEDLERRRSMGSWGDKSKKGRSEMLDSMNVINDKKDKGKIILRTGEKYELLKKIIAIRGGGDTLDGLVNIRPNTKIQRPGRIYGKFSDKITEYRPFGVFIEWMDSYDGKKDGNEYWYGTNEEETTVECTNEEKEDLDVSYGTNTNWGKMPADIEAGLEWMEAFDNFSHIYKGGISNLLVDQTRSKVIKAEKKERNNATMKIRAKMYNSSHASLIEGEAAANKKKMEKFLIDKKVTRKIFLQVLTKDGNDWGNKGQQSFMTIEELWKSHGGKLNEDYKKPQDSNYPSFKSDWTMDNSFKVENRKYGHVTRGGGVRSKLRYKENMQQEKERMQLETKAKSDVKEGTGDLSRNIFIKNIRDICDDHAAAVKNGSGTEWENRKLNQLTGPGNWVDVWSNASTSDKYKIRWANVNTDYSSIAEETWYNPTAQRTCMINGIKIARGIDDQKGSKKKIIVREDDYPDPSKVKERYGSDVINKGKVYDDNFFQNTKKRDFKQSFPAGLYEVPAHTLFWVGWSETHNTNYLPKESKEAKDSFMGQPFIVREGKKENDNTGKNRDRINIRIPKTLLSTIGGFFNPHSLTLNTEGNNDNTDNLCVLHHNYDRKGVTNHRILNTLDIDTIEWPEDLRTNINMLNENSNKTDMESAQVYKNSILSILELTKKAREKTLKLKGENDMREEKKDWGDYLTDYINVKNIELNLRKTQEFIQNARYTIVKDEHKYAADFQFENKIVKNKTVIAVKARKNRRSLGLLGLIDKHINTAGKNKKKKQNKGRFTSYYNKYIVNVEGWSRDMYDDDNKKKLIPYKYVNDINISMAIDKHEKKDDTWENQPYTSLKYKEPNVVINSDYKGLEDAQVDIMVIDTTNKYNEVKNDAENYLNADSKNGALQLFSCEIDLGGIGQNGNRLDIGLQHRYFNPEYGGWFFRGKEKNAWNINKAILDRTIKTRGGSNKKRFTRKK